MVTAPRIYSFARAEGVEATRRRVPEAMIAAWGFNAVQPVLVEDDSLATAAEHGLAVVADVFPDHGWSDESPVQRLEGRIRALLARGVIGINCRRAHEVSSDSWRAMFERLRSSYPAAWFSAEALGRTLEEQWALQTAGFDFLLSSVGWWNGRDPWYFEQQGLYAKVGRSIGFPVGLKGRSARDRLHRYQLAALVSSGVMLGAGDEIGIEAEIAAVNRIKAEHAALNDQGVLESISPPSSPILGFVRRGRDGTDPIVMFLNPTDANQPVELDAAFAALPADVADLRDIALGQPQPPLLPVTQVHGNGLRLLEGIRDLGGRAANRVPPAPGGRPSHVIIERVSPEIDGGEFPVKRIEGDLLRVSADIFRDGHDKLAAALLVRQRGDRDWAVVPLRPIENDRWEAAFTLTAVGEAHFQIEAWTDTFASWADEVRKKRAAGQSVETELAEGRALLDQAVGRAAGPLRARLAACAAALDDPALSLSARLAVLLSRLLERWMAQAPDKSDAAFTSERRVNVDRTAARFSAWYEMFPRSQGTDPAVSSTFAECAARFPAVRALGFDVVYFVPIHPIGEINRKGRNNNPRAQPGEPGSPYAIGSRHGGHTAIEPGLGTLEDFREMVRAARHHGLEIALDFAVQCAPDHPWLKEHPEWFRRRPDGTIKYAENPPKKYEDIVNVDFDGPGWHALWNELLAAVQFWVREGVKIFRVDNPHTKPVAFWHWLIDSVRQNDPDVIFFAEAFTRPKMMRRLAKAGFAQSYTYFTWRTTKTELTDYLTELTQTESVEYFRPNFFPTTPDILPFHLQTGGRAMFRARLALAATLSPAYGIYNGYELCEAGGLPGKEEYEDSEKYQFKVRDWNRPGNIQDDITRLNRLRRGSPALRLFANLSFHPSSHPDVLFYSKSIAGGTDRIFVAVTLNPHAPAVTEIVFPPAVGARFATTELFSGHRQEWSGDRHLITLNPADQPALVWKVL
jgi:starch synthase (maltosyl-transferring)